MSNICKIVGSGDDAIQVSRGGLGPWGRGAAPTSTGPEKSLVLPKVGLAQRNPTSGLFLNPSLGR